jgi:hypothetical protein
MSMFSQNSKQGKFGTILHNLAEDPNCDVELLKELISESSILRECINSRNTDGFTPVMLAIKFENLRFLDTVQDCPSLFIKMDQRWSEVINSKMRTEKNKVKLETKIRILKFIASNIKSISGTKINIVVE